MANNEKCYYNHGRSDEKCEGELWVCETCGKKFCQYHWNQTDQGHNVECLMCEEKRINNKSGNKFKIWIQIGEIDEEGDYVQDIDLNSGSIAEFNSKEDAVACADEIQEAGEAIAEAIRLYERWPVSRWQIEVANGKTQLGYVEWVETFIGG